jgi:hypothetical protein
MSPEAKLAVSVLLSGLYSTREGEEIAKVLPASQNSESVRIKAVPAIL